MRLGAAVRLCAGDMFKITQKLWMNFDDIFRSCQKCEKEELNLFWVGREFWNFKSLILSDVKKEDSGDDEGKEVTLRMAGSGVSMGRSGDESG